MNRRKPPLTLATITPREREHLSACVHEGGHAVATVALGGVIRTAVVSNSKVTGVEGLTTFAEDVPAGRRPEILYAGPWAQAKFLAGGRASRPTRRQVLAVLDGGGGRDCAELSLAGGTHLGHAVTPVIERCWPAVIRVAQQLYRTGEVGQADVVAALGITDGGGPGSSQLASLRAAGFRSVPPIT